MMGSKEYFMKKEKKEKEAWEKLKSRCNLTTDDNSGKMIRLAFSLAYNEGVRDTEIEHTGTSFIIDLGDGGGTR